MPEGDTIFRAAAVLRSALVGRELLAFDAPRLSGPRPTIGTLIEEVRSRGKHLDRVFLVMNPDKLGATTPTL